MCPTGTEAEAAGVTSWTRQRAELVEAREFLNARSKAGKSECREWPFYSRTDPATWGAGLPGSPIFASNDTRYHLTTLVVVVQRWSDGKEDR